MWIALSFGIPHVIPPTPDPRAIVAAAIDAIGGRERVEALTALRLDGIQHEYMLGNAERADGPWRTQYTRFSELWDVANARVRRTATNAISAPGATPVEQVWIITDSVMGIKAGPRAAPGYGGFYEDFLDRMHASPPQVLLDALHAPTLKWERVVTRYGVPHDVIAFRTASGSTRIEVARTTHLPDAVEVVRQARLEMRRAMFGDATLRVEHIDWTIQPGGWWWPMQQRFLFNGDFFRDITYTRMSSTVAATDSFAVSDSVRTAYAAATRNSAAFFKLGSRPEPPQPGGDIVRLADNWAMTLVKQTDGVVIFEAHLSDQYIKQVVAEVHRRWPGSPIKAFVITSDPWAHLGGFREVVALGIPIYVNGGSIPFLRALAAAPHTLAPDDLARTPRQPKLIAVDSRTAIGSGSNRIELYPVGGAYSERMTMAYFPERRLLYGSDLLFPDRSNTGAPLKTFLPTPAIELQRAVTRERLAVDSVFVVQPGYPIFAWKDVIPTGS